MLFNCVSQGNVQRWRLKNEHDMKVIDCVFRRGDPPETVQEGHFRFTLVSSHYSHFESIVSVTAMASQENHVLECASSFHHDAVTIHITGF